MHPQFDAVASLRVWAVDAVLGGRVLRVPALPASDWLPVLMTGDLMSVVGLLEDFDLAGGLTDDLFTVAELRDVLVEIVEAACGRPVAAALGIAGAAGQRWDVIGADLARVGVRFDQISIGAGLDAIYGSVCRALDEKGLAEFNRVIQLPLGEGPRPVRQPRGAKPLPASALPYVQTRPKTRPRKPEDRQGDANAQPTPLPETPADSGPLSMNGPLPLGGGAGSPQEV